MNIDGSNLRCLTNHQQGSWAPAWSPSGQSIVFVSNRESSGGDSDIWRLDLDETGNPVNPGQPKRLTFDGAVDTEPAWSPDGQQIAFVTRRDGNHDIYIMDSDGQNLRNLTDSPDDENFPTWSPDGNWIAFSRSIDKNGDGIFSNDIYVKTIEGDRTENLTDNNSDEFRPTWINP